MDGEPEPKNEASPTSPPPDIVAKPDPAQEAPDPLVVAERPPPRPEMPVESKPDKPPPDPTEEAPREPVENPTDKPPMPTAVTLSEAQAAVVTGGAMSHAAAVDSIDSEAAAGAAPGELARYALAVTAGARAGAAAARRPEGQGGRIVPPFTRRHDRDRRDSSFEWQSSPGQRRARRRARRHLSTAAGGQHGGTAQLHRAFRGRHRRHPTIAASKGAVPLLENASRKIKRHDPVGLIDDLGNAKIAAC